MIEQETRQEHLKWCKQRAFEYLDAGNVEEAWASFGSDMSKHTQTKNHAALLLGTQLLIGGHLSSVAEMRKFIEGFN